MWSGGSRDSIPAARASTSPCGAAGSQGGSVAAALEGKYTIRTLTRDPGTWAAAAVGVRAHDVRVACSNCGAAARRAAP